MAFLTVKHKELLSTKTFYKESVNIRLPFFNNFYINFITLASKYRAFQKYDQATNKVIKLVFIPQIICKKSSSTSKQ